jgi:hypothetical protein
MGEIADDHIDYMLSRGMYPFSRGKRPQHRITCERCGASNLKWRETESGWRLFEPEHCGERVQHECNPISESEFEPIPDGDQP